MKYPDEFKELIVDLKSKSKILKTTSLSIILMTTLNLFIILTFISKRFNVGGIRELYFSKDIVMIATFLGLIVLGLLITHYQTINKANLIFDELSEEVEWNYRNNVNKPERIPLDLRLITKEYYLVRSQFNLDKYTFQILFFLINFGIMVCVNIIR